MPRLSSIRKPICGWRSRIEPLGAGERPRLAEDLLGNRKLAEIVEAAGEAGQLDLLLVEPEPRCDPGGELGDARRVTARVGVSEVDCLRQACSGAEAGGAVRPDCQPSKLGELDDVRPIDVDTVLAVLLRPVEGAVREADELAAVRCLSRERRDPRGDGYRADVIELDGCNALDDRGGRLDRRRLGAVGQQESELVAAQAERLTVLAQGRRKLGEDVVTGGVAEEVVDALEIVDVHEAETEWALVPLRVDQLALETIVEVAVVAEPGQRIGQRELHRAERAIGRALVERDREQRADERSREEWRALPEHDEHQRRRRHQREDR